MIYSLSVIAITFLFYLLIPGTGAFIARRQWREFREKLAAASIIPSIDFHKSRLQTESGYLGFFKFFGSLEAIQDKYEVWLRSGNFTVSVDMRKVKIYLLPAFSYAEGKDDIYEKNREIIMDEMPQVLSWDRFFSLSQRTDVMVCGPLFMEKGKTIFRASENGTITFLIYDGKPESLLRRGVWAGRHRNEFWNIFTPVSLIAGSFALFLAAYYLYSIPSLVILTRITLGLSLVPFMPLFPPGVILFFTYRYFWKKARFLRAERDLVKLPLRFFSDHVPEGESGCADTGTGGKYCYKRIENRDVCVALCREKGLVVRSASVCSSRHAANPDTGNIPYYYFYPEINAGEPDPLHESIVIEGNPEIISRECRRRAKILEYTSIAVFISGMAINFTLTYLFISSING